MAPSRLFRGANHFHEPEFKKKTITPPPQITLPESKGFMNEETYDNVVAETRLPSGLLFGLPVVLDTNDPALVPGTKVLLTKNGVSIATMKIDSR